MDLDTYITNLTKLQEQFTPLLLNKIRGQSTKLLAEKIALRVQQKGINSEGAKFSPYSKRYKAFREKKGRQTAFKDFTFTGQMFAKVRVTKEEQETDSSIIISIGTEDSEQQQKLNWVSEKEKINIIGISKEEAKEFDKFLHQCADEILEMK